MFLPGLPKADQVLQDIGMINIDLDVKMHLFENEGRLRKLRLGFELDEQWEGDFSET